MADPLLPQFFVTRQNGNMVPLIAMDELPPTVSVRDVSRSLSSYDVSGMTGIGTFNARHRQHVVENTSIGLNNGFGSNINGIKPAEDNDNNGFQLDQDRKSDRKFVDKSLMASSYAHADHGSTMASVNKTIPIHGNSNGLVKGNSNGIFPQPPKAYGIQEQAPVATLASPFAPTTPIQSLRVDRNANGSAKLPPWHDLSSLPLQAAPGVKEYCSYWLRHGECDYAQQGCLYRHEMPLDRATLERLGLRDIPRWYREQHGLGSYLAGGATTNGVMSVDSEKKRDMDRNWRAYAADVLPEGIRRKPEHGHSEYQVYPTERRVFSSTSSNSMRFPPLTPPSTTSFKPNGTLVSTANGHRFNSPSKAGVPAHTSAPGVATRKLIPAPEPQKETVRDRQMRATIAALDAHDLQEKERLLLAEKYTVLEPEKKYPSTPDTGTTCTPTTSQDSGEAFEEIQMGEIVAKTDQAPTVGKGLEEAKDRLEKLDTAEPSKEPEKPVAPKVETPRAAALQTPPAPASANVQTPKRPTKQTRRKNGRDVQSARSTPTPPPRTKKVVSSQI